MTIKKNIFFIAVFIATVLALFINKLTTPRVLSTNELLVNGLFMFEEPKKISDFSFYSANGVEFTKDDLQGKMDVDVFASQIALLAECPTTMYKIKELINILRNKNFPLDDKQWVLVSIDPERDTPEEIDKYAKGFDEDFIGVSNIRPMLLSLATQLSVNNVMPSESNGPFSLRQSR